MTAVEWLEMEIVKLEKDYAIPGKLYELSEQAKEMEKQIFKVGDEVYHVDYGWGLIDYISNLKDELHPIQVTFEHETMYFTKDGRYYNSSKNKSLSFTEYTLQGFSQERPIELPEVGELCLVRDIDNHSWSVRKFAGYNPNAEYPYITEDDVSYKKMKRIKILD